MCDISLLHKTITDVAFRNRQMIHSHLVLNVVLFAAHALVYDLQITFSIRKLFKS